MKVAVLIVCFASISINGYADAKWIPIEPMNTNETPKPDTDTSKARPASKWMENVQIIRRLLDRENKTGADAEKQKSWYSFDHTEND